MVNEIYSEIDDLKRMLGSLNNSISVVAGMTTRFEQEKKGERIADKGRNGVRKNKMMQK